MTMPGFILTKPEHILYYHMLAQRNALKLEIKGFKFNGGSVSAHIKRAYGIKAHRKVDVLDQFTTLIEQRFNVTLT